VEENLMKCGGRCGRIYISVMRVNLMRIQPVGNSDRLEKRKLLQKSRREYSG
jgi:hypothetical protein